MGQLEGSARLTEPTDPSARKPKLSSDWESDSDSDSDLKPDFKPLSDVDFEPDLKPAFKPFSDVDPDFDPEFEKYMESQSGPMSETAKKLYYQLHLAMTAYDLAVNWIREVRVAIMLLEQDTPSEGLDRAATVRDPENADHMHGFCANTCKNKQYADMSPEIYLDEVDHFPDPASPNHFYHLQDNLTEMCRKLCWNPKDSDWNRRLRASKIRSRRGRRFRH